ncbi:MAG: sialidase family protein [Gemmatimonadaceae bacterium]
MRPTAHYVVVGILPLLAACDISQVSRENSPAITESRTPSPSASTLFISNVTSDTTAQNETPLAVNPLNTQNLVTGNNDWNYNDGCGVNASFDGGKTWTKTLPNGFLPGITRFTNDPAAPGTGTGDFGGDPAVAFGPDGTAYFACFTYDGTNTALLLSRSTDGGRTWLAGGSAQPLTLVSAFAGKGVAKGSTGQFPDHEAMTVAADGTIYVTWAQFHGYGSNSPVFIATSRDGGRSFSTPVKVSSGSIRSDQDQRVVTNASGSVAYVTFDNSIQGGKGTAMYISRSVDHGQTWSTPSQLGTFQNPVCLFPPYCFNITGGAFRGPGSYPAPSYNVANDRIYVAYADIIDGVAKVLLTSASASNISSWTAPQVVAPVAVGDRFAAELSTASNGRIDIGFYDRSYSGNSIVDVTYATSLDFGATWETSRVSKSGFDPSKYGVPSGSGISPFIGDYNGIISTATGAGLTWTGVGKTFGTLPTNLEIFFGSVTP